MGIKVVDLQADYMVHETQNVALSIKIGDTQIGASIVKLDGTEKGKGDIQNLNLGQGNAIKSQVLNIKSVVTDVNDMTNRTSITYTFNGGVSNQSFSSKATVDDNGDSVVYRAKFTFI